MDLILGRETIKHNNLVFHFPSHFTKVHTTTTSGDGGSEESENSRTGDLGAVRYPRVVTAMHYRKLSDDSHSINSYSDSEWHAPAFEAFDAAVEEVPLPDDLTSVMTIETDDDLIREDIVALINE